MPAKRVLISIDERLLSRVDELCERRGYTRSGYLAQLAAADLEGHLGPGSGTDTRQVLRSIEEIAGSDRR